MSQYHKTDYLLQEQSQKYYARLIDTLNPSKNQFLLFGEKSMFNNEDIFKQNYTNVTSAQYNNNYLKIPIITRLFQVEVVWCKNGECENCKEKMPKPLAIVNQAPEIKIIDEQNQSKSKLNQYTT